MTASPPSAESGSHRLGAADETEPATGLLVNGGDHCANCGSALAIDQRYCVECGTRRGKPRFAIAGSDSDPASGNSAAPAGATSGWSRISAALALIAVLLALGVGVLIGDSSGSAGGAGSGGASAGSVGTSAGSVGTSGGSAATTCASGTAGCKNGRQTGNFFGG